jgi:hypothetical protein
MDASNHALNLSFIFNLNDKCSSYIWKLRELLCYCSISYVHLTQFNNSPSIVSLPMLLLLTSPPFSAPFPPPAAHVFQVPTLCLFRTRPRNINVKYHPLHLFNIPWYFLPTLNPSMSLSRPSNLPFNQPVLVWMLLI